MTRSVGGSRASAAHEEARGTPRGISRLAAPGSHRYQPTPRGSLPRRGSPDRDFGPVRQAAASPLERGRDPEIRRRSYRAAYSRLAGVPELLVGLEPGLVDEGVDVLDVLGVRDGGDQGELAAVARSARDDRVTHDGVYFRRLCRGPEREAPCLARRIRHRASAEVMVGTIRRSTCSVTCCCVPGRGEWHAGPRASGVERFSRGSRAAPASGSGGAASTSSWTRSGGSARGSRRRPCRSRRASSAGRR